MAASVPSPVRYAAGAGWGQVSPGGLFALLAAVLACTSPAVLDDGDTWTHVAAGRWMLEHGSVLRFDPFSATMAGQPWDAHEWLGEVLLAGAFRLAGPTGVVLLAAAAAALLFGRLARDVEAMGGWWAATLLTAGAVVAVMPSLLARPHLLALPVLEAWTAGLLRARAAGRGPSPRLLGLMILWANLHGGFAFGIALAGAFAAEAMLAQRAGWAWAAFVGGSVLAAAATPQGVDGLLFPWRLLQLRSLSLISEWQPVDLGSDYGVDAVLLGLGALLVSGRVRVGWFRGALVAGLVYLTLAHARHGVLLGVVGALVLAAPVGRGFRREARRVVVRGVCLAGVAVVLGMRLALPVEWAEGRASPVAAAAELPPGVGVLNSYAFGGYLALVGLRPLIDGRAELFGDHFVEAYVGLARASAGELEARLQEDRIGWAVLGVDDPLVGRMEGLEGWRRTYEDRAAVVFRRE